MFPFNNKKNIININLKINNNKIVMKLTYKKIKNCQVIY